METTNKEHLQHMKIANLKYLVPIINLVILTVLLAFWTDSLERTFDELVRPFEFLKIIFFTILSLIGIGILHYFLPVNLKRKKLEIITSITITILASSYLYISFIPKVIHNIAHHESRNQIFEKIKPANGMAHGTKATNLTMKEYLELRKLNGFPIIPQEATNINYIHQYDGFLPDYLLTISYALPQKVKVDIVDFNKGGFIQQQTCEPLGNKQLVTYTEILQ
jgi:hypothetical protein